MFGEFTTELTAKLLKTSDGLNCNIRFNELLNFIYKCYLIMLDDTVMVPHNNENKIRDILLLNYLNDNSIRHMLGMTHFLFDPEVPENNGRSDIKVQTYDTFQDTKAYYILECKRLNGQTTLNHEYVNNGINRFTTKYYSSYFNINGMIGFIIHPINIDENMRKIGDFFDLIEENKLYQSTHDGIILYHLMMDFSNNIETNL
ncbi:hypothetical protein [Sulfuricurvum sp. RIFCSPLOWO2_12_FULL_43_24]|uniref:hypothetical protein n=1 Tax=Sulfuricurvum sp. RIFCSPLOWO2_12_FULL_43_24 TaxID=1802247 RepID=UPI0008BACB94|nr:hypothetical protein [Sulfuricurvum sp. RIFCSPLOWO2_12_FULL_43_24]OHD85441.1 MAG: hypothetical protein A3I60_06590 [Sulfuricurvum sp. RIFCSPLOWO2_02_FULL_43_45]OHD90075.1 MAG: hypothetical protein A3G19_11660 [Sulfuricurvum sp. RIFCSPLOWO2_12_FULL_43_24]